MKTVRVLLCLSLLMAAFALVAQAEPIGRPNVPTLNKKTEQFHVVVDTSGSMMMTSKTMADLKVVLAQRVLGALNDRLPLLDYSAALSTVTPVKNVSPAGKWNRAAFGKAVASLPANLDVFGRLTNLGADLTTLSGSFGGNGNSVILVTDGWANIGPDTLDVVRSIVAKGVRFHVISFADTAPGAAVVKGIAGLDNNSVIANGEALLIDPVALDEFIKAVFYTEDQPIVVSSVYFASGSDKLDSTAMSTLDTLARHIMNTPRGVRSVEIEGFADITGSADRNARLSERRSISVRTYLTGKGVPAEKLYIQGNGVSYEFNNATTDGRHNNRRVTLIIN